MAGEEAKPFPEVKEYVKNYVFDKEHKDTYKKLVGAYSVKERRTDNRLHQKSRTKVLNDLESMADSVDAVEHEDHIYDLLGKILHKYENAKVDIHNKGPSDIKKSKLDYDELGYKKKAQELIAAYLQAHEGQANMSTLINEIKEGNVEDVVNKLLDAHHTMYQQTMAVHKMEKILPPNKSADFYFKLANFWASKRQQDYTEADLREIGRNRDSIVKNFMSDYNTANSNELKKMKPEKKKK